MRTHDNNIEHWMTTILNGFELHYMNGWFCALVYNILSVSEICCWTIRIIVYQITMSITVDIKLNKPNKIYNEGVYELQSLWMKNKN